MKANGEWQPPTDLILEVSVTCSLVWFLKNSFVFLLDTIWVILSVAEGGTLALTQQLTHFNALGSVIPIGPPFNPFAAQNVGRAQHLHQVCHFFLFLLTFELTVNVSFQDDAQMGS